ncbi:hypothetical protein Hanom_Chr09g00816341 [Helianthus anomalus]
MCVNIYIIERLKMCVYIYILSPSGFSSHRVLHQRVLLLWWHNDCQVATGGMVSQGNAQAKL